MANERYREELREAVRLFNSGQSAELPVPSGTTLPRHINVFLFGPQGSGKTSFVRSCFRALYGASYPDVHAMESKQRGASTVDGTFLYSVYSLTDHICLHDTRGQRDYTPEEQQQLRLVLEGRARPNTLIQQRRRYWLLLREFWRSEGRSSLRAAWAKMVAGPP